MKPIEFKDQNTVYAKDQDEYLSLPAHRSDEGIVTTCWKLTWFERLQMLFSGKVYLQLLTFGKLLQPQLLHTSNPLTKD